MQLLTTTRVYDVENDRSHPDFLELLKSPPEGIIIHEGNAGLGADWPVGVWTSARALAVAWAIFAAPATIEENWPIWKEIFDSVAEKIKDFHGEFSIDRDSAQVIAMHYATAELGLDAARLEVHMAIRHFFTTAAGYQDLLNSDRQVMQWYEGTEADAEVHSEAIRSTEEAARQACCRYLYGISDHNRAFTVVVEQDGSVSFVEGFNMNREWG